MNQTKEAIKYIIESCPKIGAFYSYDALRIDNFLKQVSSDISQSQTSEVFPDRYREHVAYALDMIAHNDFTSPPAAIASVYLNTRFERYFRIISGKLRTDGK